MTECLEVGDSIHNSEHSVAKAFHHYFGHQFRYLGKSKWAFWNGRAWQNDAGGTTIRKTIRNELGGVLMRRALFWQAALKNHTCADEHAAEYRVATLLHVTHRLTKPAFVSSVVRELPEWFEEGP
jgi:hypothetical protein